MITILKSHTYRQKNKTTGDYFMSYAENTFFCKRIEGFFDVTPASMVSKFILDEQVEVWDLETLLPKLEALENDPHRCVIRYPYRLARVGDVVTRRAEDFLIAKSHIVAVDVDSLTLPKGMDSTNVEAQGKYVLNLLNELSPDFFNKDSGFIAQASSSAGLSDKIKLHLWFKNKSPLTQQQIKNAMYHVNKQYKKEYDTKDDLIDLALYNIGQIHYTSAPIFHNKDNDPFKNRRRTVFVSGDKIYIPETYLEYIAPIKATKVELDEYLKKVQGSCTLNLATEKWLDVVRGWEPKRRGLRTKVIALYHNALQSQYNLEELDKEVLKYLDVTRPGQGASYIAQAKEAAMNHIKSTSSRDINNEVLGIKVAKLDGGSHPKYLTVNSFPKGGATFLKASLGTGKTATIERMLHNNIISGTFLAITDTSALVEANAARFNALDFRHQDSISNFNLKHFDRLSGTIHSLTRLEAVNRNIDFIFIDEADSVLNTLLFASIIEETKRLRIIEVLSRVMQKADKIVLSDGDLSQETVQAYVDLMEGSKDIYKLVHTRKNLKDVKCYRHKSTQSLWGAVSASLETGSKCLVVTDNSPDYLNIHQDSLKRLFPEKAIEVVHASSKFDDCARDIINNTTEALKRRSISCLICSPSITNGVDFNYFDSVFVLTSTAIHSPNMRFQALMRERNPEEIHYYISPTIKEFTTGYSGLSLDLGWLNSTRKLISARKEREFKTYGATFNYYLIKAGCTIEYVDEPYKSPKEQEDEEAYYEERTNALLSGGFTDSFIPRHNDVNKLHIVAKGLYGVEELSYDEAKDFVMNRPDLKFESFYTIVEEFWDIVKHNDPDRLRTVLKGNRGHRFFLLTGSSINSKPPRKILDECGIYEGTDMEEYIEQFKRFCLVANLPIPQVINNEGEQARDLGVH